MIGKIICALSGGKLQNAGSSEVVGNDELYRTR